MQLQVLNCLVVSKSGTTKGEVEIELAASICCHC